MDGVGANVFSTAQQQADNRGAHAAGKGHDQCFQPCKPLIGAQRRNVVQRHGERGMRVGNGLEMNAMVHAGKIYNDVIHSVLLLPPVLILVD
ncbi:hypothetical protein SDC9_170594 [bioreactor metagenome]|uniref:Uncharacterized protein n=1 Tax=bioreactor metagenome TaxID=1076179 RepID=A0A645GAQ4_9ZZZZ